MAAINRSLSGVFSGPAPVTTALLVANLMMFGVEWMALIDDPKNEAWADDARDRLEGHLDILMQVYGDAALLGTDGQPRSFVFLTGSLPDLHFPNGGSLPVEAKNKKWDWILFRIENATRADGTRYVGIVPPDAQGATAFGGVNGGTIRAEGVPNLIVRLVAFGERGAFGEDAQREGDGALLDRSAQDAAESDAFRQFVERDGEGHRDPQSQRNG